MAADLSTELRDQMSRAGTDPIQAVVQLHMPRVGGGGLSATDSNLAQSVLDRVIKDSGQSPHRVNILRNAGAIIVEAGSDFIRSLVSQPEVASAMANRTAESPYIAPVKKRPVD